MPKKENHECRKIPKLVARETSNLDEYEKHTIISAIWGSLVHSQKSKKVFQDQPFNSLDPWLGASPDLNIIENVWSDMKKKVALRSPSTYEELVNFIKEVWTQEITDDYCKRLVDSMPNRISAVLKAHGGTTKY